MKIPFPQMGKKKEDVVKKEEPVEVLDEDVPDEIPALEDEIKRQDVFKQIVRDEHLVCSHEVSLALFVKTNLMMCGHCRRAMFLPNNNVWLKTDEVFPEEWLTQK